MPYYLIFDLVILGILVLFACLGFHRGLILSLCSLVAVLVALVGAGFVARTVSPMVAGALEPKFAAAIEARLDESIQSSMDGAQPLPEGETPDIPLQDVLNILKEMGFYQNLVDTVNQAVEKGMTEVAAGAAAQVAAAVAQSVAYAVLFAVSFGLILILWTLLGRALDLVARFPGLHLLNKSLGALFGIAKGCLILFLAAWLLQFSGQLIPEAVVEQTTLLRFFMTTSPFALLG